MLLSSRAAGNGLGDDTDVVDTGLAQSVNDRRKNSKRNRLITPQEHTLLRTPQLGVNSRTKLVNVDGIVAKVDPLPFVYGDDKAVLANIFHRARFRDVDFDAGLQDGSGNHENDEQDENHVHERDHVDLGERSLR